MVNKSVAFRIASDTLARYLSLLNHLSGVVNTHGWSACKSQLELHGNNFTKIRHQYRHQIQCVAQIYIYLRENQSKNWISLKTQQSELKALRVKMEKHQRFGDVT